MKVEAHYTRLLAAATRVAEATTADLPEQMGDLHAFLAELKLWRAGLSCEPHVAVLDSVAHSLVTGAFAAVLGMYRSAFGSLRLGYELGLAVPFFAVHPLRYREWILERSDLRWGDITSTEQGVFSIRVVRAWRPEAEEYSHLLRDRSASTYRSLSEQVHGNAHTWASAGGLKHDQELLATWCSLSADVLEQLTAALAIRYSTLSRSDGLVECVVERLQHYPKLRDHTAGNWNDD